jgi:hypothetical protein
MRVSIELILARQVILYTRAAISSLLRAAWLLPLLATSAGAQSMYCALNVIVRSPSGSPVPNLPVVLVRKDGSPFLETTTAGNGVARLCDAPFESIDIFVGRDVCGAVRVQNLRPKWPVTQRVAITYQSVACDHFNVDPECQVLLRVRDETGKPISGARLEGMRSGSGSGLSDTLGRIFWSIKRWGHLEGVVAHEGLKSAGISTQCVDDTELTVVLSMRQFQ